MKLEVGMWVRYKYEKNVYIGKIKFISEVMCGLNETLQIEIDNCMEEILIRYISKASHNIIDLIEVGDYVNGYKVLRIEKDYLFDYREEINILIVQNDEVYEVAKKIYSDGIKSIVTKEQFESMSYKVGE